MRNAPREPERVVYGDAWWSSAALSRENCRPRRRARRLTDRAEHSAHGVNARVDAEFHAGWIALRFLNDLPGASDISNFWRKSRNKDVTSQANTEAPPIAGARPDLVIADLSFRDSDGLELVRRICSRHAGLRLLVLTEHEAPSHARLAFAAGAIGYITKSEPTETLLIAIRSMLRGEV